ncbi:MAG TPA: hypothetical protein PK546_03865 [Chitinophagales bacterium]|nr:hypothetical protein [Chitinophagales bacterium]
MTILQIENKIDKIIIIINEAKFLMNDSYKMLMTDTSAKHVIINRNKFLTRVRESFWKLAVIELAKIYDSKNDKFRLEHFLNTLIENHKKGEYKLLISKKELNSLLSFLQKEDVLEKVEKLKEVRDKHYAHTDENAKSLHEIKFYFTDFVFLLRTAELIIESINNKLFNKQRSFKSYFGDEADEFLNLFIENTEACLINKITKR